MKFKRGVLIFFFVIAAFSSFLPLCSMGNASEREEQLSALSTGTVFYGYAYALGGKIGSELSQIVFYDEQSGLAQIRLDSAIFDLLVETTPDGNLQNSKWTTKNKELIKLLGHDERRTFYDVKNRRIRIEYYLGDKLKTTKSIAYEKDTLDSDLIYLYLQEKLANGVEEFKGNVILKARGMRVNVMFQRKTMKDLAGFSPEYDFPGQFRESFDRILGKEAEVYVYVMQLTGVYKVFYPYKYYTAFSKSTPHRWLAFWGGAPNDADFIVIHESRSRFHD